MRCSRIRPFCLAAKIPRPLKIDRLSSHSCRGGTSPLRLHALGLCYKSSNELGIYAGCRGIFLFDQPLSISREPFRRHREVARSSHGNFPSKAAIEESRATIGPSGLRGTQLWIGFFWRQLIKAFSIVGLIGYFASFPFSIQIARSPRGSGSIFCTSRLCLRPFLQPLTANSKIDNADWWTQMPFHTYTNLIFATLFGTRRRPPDQ